MKQYFTYRLFPLPGGFIKPDKMLQVNFPEITFSYKLSIASDRPNDGKNLGYLESNSQDDINLIIDAMSIFNAKAITIEEAEAFAKKIYVKEADNIAINGDVVNITYTDENNDTKEVEL
jgi:hypothetical protein